MSLIAPEAKSSSQGILKYNFLAQINAKMRVAKFAEHTRSPSTLLDELRTEMQKPTFSLFRISKCAKSSAIIVSSFSVFSLLVDNSSAKMYTGVSGRIRPHETGRNSLEVHSSWSDPKTKERLQRLQV